MTISLDDRGPARYRFVGRQELRDEFTAVFARVRETGRGSIYLIQGPPGVGKTALLHQLRQEAAAAKWHTTRIEINALHSPTALAEATDQSATTGRTITGEGGGGGVRVRAGFLEGDVSGRGSRQTEYAGTSIDAILRELGKRKAGTLLILDEVQSLGLLSGDRVEIVSQTLRQIHEGHCGGPVVLLAGGLGHSQTEFAKLGISRFRGGAVINLGRLSDKTAGDMVKDYLTEGDRERKPMEGQEALVQDILARSHGWPQHLVAYGESAQRVLPEKRAAHRITADERGRILKMGDQARESYYRARIGKWGLRGTALLGALVQNPRRTERWDRATLNELTSAQALGASPVPGLVDRAIAKGVLAELPHAELYHVPIPSMARYLVNQLELYRREMPDRVAELTAAVEAVLPALARQTDLEAGVKTIGQTRHPVMMYGGLGAGSSRGDLER